MKLSTFLKSKRKSLGMTQADLSQKAGVGLRLVREIEQGKTSMRMDKVNQILDLFGSELSVATKQKHDD
jgi:y4mF family transcriptional regulator